MSTIFTKIINKELPSAILYEDELAIAILDIAPVNKGHTLVISKKEVATIGECPDQELAHLMTIVKKIDAKMRDTLKVDATNIVINNGRAAGQEVPHLHIHIIPRYENDHKTVVPSKAGYEKGELESYAVKLALNS